MNIQYLISKISDNFYDFLNQFRSPPNIKLIDETIEYIIEKKCSVSRFGDGELWVLLGGSISYQTNDKKLQARLKEILSSNKLKENHIVAIPDVFEEKKLSLRTEKNQYFWRNHLAKHRKDWYRFLRKNKQYFNNGISRFYSPILDKNKSEIYLQLLKKIWENKSIIIIEGEKSRLGVGNDLFDNSKNIERIICPPENAFDKYDEIIDSIKGLDKEKLVLIALGPTATVLSYDLHNIGFWAIDIGHVDIEYEWYKMGASEAVKIENKYTNESEGGNVNILDVLDEKYKKQILFTIN
ncbi:SP_1767 family glycosyltransferase [Yeosuana sp. AK3]